MSHNLAQPFYENSLAHPDNVALVVNETQLSYAELADLAGRIARWLSMNSAPRSGRVGILASRSLEAYAGILGTLWSGAAYVPLNPRTPEDRLIHILQATSLDALIVDQTGATSLTDRVLAHAPGHVLTQAEFSNLSQPGLRQPVPLPGGTLAYIIFTSGSTGVPKGVMIEAGSVTAFRSVVQQRCGFLPSDRVSQVAELTFDNSVLDMFVTWAAGAGLYVIPESQLIAPGKFIREHALTIWFSVPSTACFMQRMKMLKPEAFPSLRLSIFAGEALPIATAQAWQIAAPNSVVENFYGPTEVTVDCIAQRLDDPPNITRNRGSLAIGMPFPGIEARVVDPQFVSLPADKEGELIVSGRQVARGYLNDPDLTALRFPTHDGKRWYRTGDLAYQDDSGTIHYLGRADNQVKILGNRVELEEVEAHLREIVGTDMIAAVAWPLEDGRATGLVAFHCASHATRETIRDGMKKRVPAYMVPQRVQYLDKLPLGSTGKVDRKALIRMLNEASEPETIQG